MIRDLVVNLTVTANRDVAAEFAISIAETFQAHVAGIAFAYEPVRPGRNSRNLLSDWSSLD